MPGWPIIIERANSLSLWVYCVFVKFPKPLHRDNPYTDLVRSYNSSSKWGNWDPKGFISWLSQLLNAMTLRFKSYSSNSMSDVSVVFQCDGLSHGTLGTTVLGSKNGSSSYLPPLLVGWLKYTEQQGKKSLKGLKKSEKSARRPQVASGLNWNSCTASGRLRMWSQRALVWIDQNLHSASFLYLDHLGTLVPAIFSCRSLG